MKKERDWETIGKVASTLVVIMVVIWSIWFINDWMNDKEAAQISQERSELNDVVLHYRLALLGQTSTYNIMTETDSVKKAQLDEEWARIKEGLRLLIPGQAPRVDTVLHDSTADTTAVTDLE